MMEKFKHKDIIVREYPNGRNSIGVYYLDVREFLYLDKTFSDIYVGLTQFHTYSLGTNQYTYRKPTIEELIYICGVLKDHKYIRYLKAYLNKIRAFKIKKLNGI